MWIDQLLFTTFVVFFKMKFQFFYTKVYRFTSSMQKSKVAFQFLFAGLNYNLESLCKITDV